MVSWAGCISGMVQRKRAPESDRMRFTARVLVETAAVVSFQGSSRREDADFAAMKASVGGTEQTRTECRKLFRLVEPTTSTHQPRVEGDRDSDGDGDDGEAGKVRLIFGFFWDTSMSPVSAISSICLEIGHHHIWSILEPFVLLGEASALRAS
ncbi:hypothetical protein MGYG_01359 [Nannizzia gypsea CBS 118893]|uniref:Uncharacterized protein n=1 Tax=Arthroderma gypseum (strain ATCC MYA-4604 / CBS 118893) TaxID=535722 RepID=E5R0D0_ARTGP|nr:hypothetical protein MGYG_01359 [Nannizzia gypsea CBS 118893]EFQ98326.1 hypothetical protein MGYG_01359 [Nannizzia gypsea CBS 118893]